MIARYSLATEPSGKANAADSLMCLPGWYTTIYSIMPKQMAAGFQVLRAVAYRQEMMSRKSSGDGVRTEEQGIGGVNNLGASRNGLLCCNQGGQDQ